MPVWRRMGCTTDCLGSCTSSTPLDSMVVRMTPLHAPLYYSNQEYVQQSRTLLYPQYDFFQIPIHKSCIHFQLVNTCRKKKKKKKKYHNLYHLFQKNNRLEHHMHHHLHIDNYLIADDGCNIPFLFFDLHFLSLISLTVLKELDYFLHKSSNKGRIKYPFSTQQYLIGMF